MLWERCVRITPANNLNSRKLPERGSKKSFEHWFVKMANLPPGSCRMLKLELNDSDNTTAQTKKEPVRLAPSPAAGGSEPDPRPGNVFGIGCFKVPLPFPLVAEPLGPRSCRSNSGYKRRRLLLQLGSFDHPRRNEVTRRRATRPLFAWGHWPRPLLAYRAGVGERGRGPLDRQGQC